ncbi:MAG: pyridoxamine 5'-phosphate oxidase family protein [Bacteroidota bacterium]
MDTFEKTPRNTVKRVPKRGHYDKASIYPILDAAYICHVGFAHEGQPFVIPTAFGRSGDQIFLHGSTKSRMMMSLEQGIPACITVTHIDALVLARSTFHHSVNYRSAVIFGRGRALEGEEKMNALAVITDQILPGRWDEARIPNAKELKATTVIAIDIEQASAKIRAAPPNDERADYELPVWAGLLPLRKGYDLPEADPLLRADIPMPESVLEALKP